MARTGEPVWTTSQNGPYSEQKDSNRIGTYNDTISLTQPLRLGPMHLSNVYKYEIQRSNNFELVIEGLGDSFTLCVDSCPMPVVSNEPQELAYGNSKVKVAGQGAYEDIEVTVKDAIDTNIEWILWTWRRQVYDPQTDEIGWAQDYKRNGRIHQYAPDGSYHRSWRLIGIWPTQINCGDRNYDGGEPVKITMSLAVDKAFPIDGTNETYV